MTISSLAAVEACAPGDGIESASTEEARGRLARFLLSCEEPDPDWPKRWTRSAVAEHVGTTPRSIERMLRVFSHKGLIRLECRRLLVTDREGLRREAASERIGSGRPW